MRRTYLLAALLATAALSSAPAPAQAREAWQDCRATGGSSLQGHYTIAELQRALQTMPSYVQEYSDCLSVIEAQINRQQERGAGTGRHHKRRSDPTAHISSDSPSGGSMILIVVVVAVALVGILLAFWASRRRRGGQPPSDEPPAASA